MPFFTTTRQRRIANPFHPPTGDRPACADHICSIRALELKLVCR